MKIGIIGYGKIGKIRQRSCASLFPDASFLMHDPELDGCPGAAEVVNGSDVVFVCAPNFVNADYTIMALEAGKDVFCEKPPALSHDDLLRVKKVHDGTGLTLIYGFNHRQYDSILRMKSVIEDPRSGKILWMRGRYGKAMGDPGSAGWRSDPGKSGGGILIDQGIHMLDLMNWFGGQFDVVQSIMTNTLWGVEGIEDNVFINLYNSEDNISASLHSTMIEWRHIFSLEIVMERTYVALNGLKTPSGSYGKEVLTICQDKHSGADEQSSTMTEFKNNRTWDREVQNFFNSVDGGEGRSNIEDALEVMRLIKEAYSGRNSILGGQA
jgi:predicted dehydrogenase